MNPKCQQCELSFEREPGFYLGAIYFNYGLTALIVAVAYPLLWLSLVLTSQQSLFVCFAFVLIFPVFFHRHARSLWLGFDELIDPQKDGNSDSGSNTSESG